MPSKFPGMDPYLEGQVWADFHHEFIASIRAELMPQLRPHYGVLIEERIYLERDAQDRGHSIRPDVTIVRDTIINARPRMTSTALMPEPVLAPLMMPEEVREAYLEIRLRETYELITVIEVLSPTNKRKNSDGQREYLFKRDAVLRSGVHFIEIDLLRDGERVPLNTPMPSSEYRVTVSRASHRPIAEVWNLTLGHVLPTIPVPLAGSDPDVMLDLQSVFNSTYDRAGYDYLVDYTHRTEPLRTEEWATWASEVLG